MNRKTLLLIGGGILGLCLCLCIVLIGVALAGGLGLTQPSADVGEKFMQSLKSGDYDGAFALCHPALQQKLGNAQGLRRTIESGRAQPVSWNFTSRSVENDEALLEGSVKMTGGDGTVTLELAKTGNDWKVTAFNLKAR